MSIAAWNELIDSMFTAEDRVKIEWVFGAIAAGDAYRFTKGLILSGPPRSGKTTLINIAREMFDREAVHVDGAAGETCRFGQNVFLVATNAGLLQNDTRMLVVDMWGTEKISEEKYLELTTQVKSEYEDIKKQCLLVYNSTKKL